MSLSRIHHLVTQDILKTVVKFYCKNDFFFFAFINLDVGELAQVQLSQGGHG